MWTRIVGWAGLMALAGTLAAHAQAVVPQYTHRGFVGTVAFDGNDRVAVTSSGGFVSVIDVASGRVLAVRRLLRSNDSGFLDTELEGPLLRTLVSYAGDEPDALTWNWVEDTVESEGASWDDRAEESGSANEVVGRGARAVNDGTSAVLHRRGEAPTGIRGEVLWIGRRSALVKRGSSLIRLRLRDLTEREMVSEGVDQAWVGAQGVVVFRNDEMNRFTLVRRNGSRQRYESGGEHSVWHVHAAPGGESVVLAGRFGIQRWTNEGVIDGACDGENLLAVDWERGLSYSRFDRCTRRGTRESYPNYGVAIAATTDGATVLLGDGRFFGRRRPRARVRDLPELECEDYGDCNWNARFVAKGELILVELNPDWGLEDGENRVVRTQSGRDVFRVPAGRRFEVSADGSRIAVLHAGGGSVRDANGRELFTFGSASPDADATVPTVTFSADGRRLVWLASDESLEVLDAEGRVEQRYALEGRPSFLSLTADGIAYGNADGTVIRTGALTHHEAAGVTPTSAACVEGHFRSLEPDLRVIRGPACSEGNAERRGDLYFRKTSGAVRIWHRGRVMTLRTVRHDRGTTPMAYTADGRWWVRGASADEAPEAPFALRRGLESLAEERPVDPGLLGALFGG